MTRTDQKILFTSLAFVAVVMKGKDTGDSEAAEQIRQLSSLIEAFCAENIINIPSITSDYEDGPLIDRMIERHIHALRDNEETRLPEDKATLVKLYDRLQHRKAQRMQHEFYASAKEAKLADLVLHYLDEEIEDGEALT